MTSKQLEVIERNLLFVKDPVVGTDIYYRFRQEDVLHSTIILRGEEINLLILLEINLNSPHCVNPQR